MLKQFPSGKLPTRKDVIQNMLYLLRPKRAGQAQRSKDDAALLLAELLQEHWLFCNLYTISNISIKKHILKLYTEFTNLLQTQKQRKNDAYHQKVAVFNFDSCKTFNIFCSDSTQRKSLEANYDLKMTDMEWTYLQDQLSESKMVCEDFVD